MVTRPDSIVIGLQENGLGVVRALARENVLTTALDSNLESVYASTRYGVKFQCADFGGLGLIESLCEVGGRLTTPGVLIPTMDRGVLLVSEHRGRIEPYFRHSLPGETVVKLLMSKTATRRYAEANGFRMPRTSEVCSEKELEDWIAGTKESWPVQFPCILKPQIKTVEFVQQALKKAFLIHSMDELREAYRLVAPWEREVVVQEWIPGPDTNLIFCLYYFNQEGDPVAWFTGRKLRQYIPYCGTGCCAEPWKDDFVRDEGVRFFRGVDYRGFGAIEFKIDARDGSYHLIEPTVGRTEHLFALAAANGVNLPYIGYCDMAELPLPQWKQNRRPVRYLNWERDLKAVRFYMASRDLTVGQWLKSLWGRKQYALFAWDDPGPLLAHIGMRLRRKSRKVVHKATMAVKAAFDAVVGYVCGVVRFFCR